MRDPILKEVKDFLELKWVSGKPLLLGYSGGPDSKALLHLFLECRRFFPLDLHLAHVDHSWRDSSRKEAESLEAEARSLDLPWHLCTLSPEEFRSGNWEEQGRLKRLAFFSSLYQKGDYQAVVLGHQAGDLAETVLKRLFEGAPLHALSGLTPSMHYEGMQIWRPLLKISKEELIDWLEKKRFSYIVDSTNESPQFLRGRMRSQILPFLNETFGKDISKNLRHIAEEAERIKDFFSHLNQPLFENLEFSKKPERLSLKGYLPMHPLQLKFLLKAWLDLHKTYVSREILAGMIDALLEKGSEKTFQMKNVRFVIFKNNVSICFSE